MRSIVLQSAKKITLFLALLAVIVVPMRTEPWGGKVITLTPATAIRIVGIRTIVSSFVVQMATGGTGRGYLLYAPTDITCSKGGAGTTLIAELSPATATAPGGSVTVPSNPDPAGGVDLSGYCVDGSASDALNAAWNIRN